MKAAALLISDQQLLNSYLQGSWLQPEQIQQRVFQALREQQPFQPDYAIRGCIQAAGLEEQGAHASSTYAHLLMSALDDLHKPLVLRGSRLHVQQEQFESWQQMLTLVMPLPIISFFVFTHKKSDEQSIAIFQDWFAHDSCLPRPYIPEMVGVFEAGVSEHHLHIMGTTESDNVWLDALQRPKAVLKYLNKSNSNTNARQQLTQINSQITLSDVYRLLRLATHLRQAMLSIIQGEMEYRSQEKLLSMLRSWPSEFNSQHPATAYTQTNSLLVNEAMLLLAFYRHLVQSRCDVFARYLHIYLLIQSLLHRLLNQQLLDKGFQQFEKITQNEVREATEERFTQRFNQLKGMYGDHIAVLEARFAPKSDMHKLRALLKAIQKGYQNSQLYQKTPLVLTAHFIKAKDKPSLLHPCRDYPLRLRLKQQKAILCQYLAKNPTMRQHVVAVDAAGNELDTGADVFAPLYRQLRSEGFKHFTYHAGEDFQHLLGGVRQVFEAIHYLDLQPGDRIGHATAIGIEPTLWLSRAAPVQQLSRGDWLDTLLFTHHVLLEMGDTESNSHAYKIESDILKLAEHIFSRHDLNLQALTLAWLHRLHDPLAADNQRNPRGFAGEILTAWHHAEVYKRAREQVAVKSDFLPVHIYRKIQDRMLQIACEKHIALEVLPTSNVRISYYHSYAEHHIHRWLDDKAAYRPIVVMGSDDPGIFSTNIFNEYAHVFISANKQSNNSYDSISKIKELVGNSKSYGFSC